MTQQHQGLNQSPNPKDAPIQDVHAQSQPWPGTTAAMDPQPDHGEESYKGAGKLLGKTQGADAGTGLKMYQQALKLNPASAIARIEYANGLVMLEGDKKMKEAEKLYAEAAECEALDAMERLDVEMAKAELEE